jgi:hypothetical protein
MHLSLVKQPAVTMKFPYATYAQKVNETTMRATAVAYTNGIGERRYTLEILDEANGETRFVPGNWVRRVVRTRCGAWRFWVSRKREGDDAVVFEVDDGSDWGTVREVPRENVPRVALERSDYWAELDNQRAEAQKYRDYPTLSRSRWG